MNDDVKPPVIAGAAPSALERQDLDSLFRLATALSRSGEMVPQASQGKPKAAPVVVLRAAEANLTPMQSLLYVAVINSRPQSHGEVVPALAARAGHQLEDKHESKHWRDAFDDIGQFPEYPDRDHEIVTAAFNYCPRPPGIARGAVESYDGDATLYAEQKKGNIKFVNISASTRIKFDELNRYIDAKIAPAA